MCGTITSKLRMKRLIRFVSGKKRRLASTEGEKVQTMRSHCSVTKVRLTQRRLKRHAEGMKC